MMTRRTAGRSRRAPNAWTLETVDLSGAFAEYNFDAANVTKDGSNLLGTVNDLSGNARHVTQGTGVNKPLWVDDIKATAIDGCTVNTADGNLKRLLKTGLGSSALYNWTVAVVTKWSTAPSAGVLQRAISVQNTATGRGGFDVGHFSTTATRYLRATKVSSGAAGDLSFGTPTVDTWELWVVRIAAASDEANATVTTRVNGSVVANSGTTFGVSINANMGIILGSSSVSGAPVQSHLYFKIWNRALNDVSIASLESTINSTFALW